MVSVTLVFCAADEDGTADRLRPSPFAFPACAKRGVRRDRCHVEGDALMRSPAARTR